MILNSLMLPIVSEVMCAPAVVQGLSGVESSGTEGNFTGDSIQFVESQIELT